MLLYDEKLSGDIVYCEFCPSNATTQVFDVEAEEWIPICRLHAMQVIRQSDEGKVVVDYPSVIIREDYNGPAFEVVENHIASENLNSYNDNGDTYDD